MNCNVHITANLRFHLGGKEYANVEAGQVYSGTVREDYVTFHVTDRRGKIQQIKMGCENDGIKVIPFKTQPTK